MIGLTTCFKTTKTTPKVMSNYKSDSLECKTWQASVSMVYHDTLKKAVKKCLKNNKEDKDIVCICESMINDPILLESAGAITSTLDRLVIMFFDKDTKEHDVVHECMHATSIVLGRKGLSLTHESEEAYCYFIGRLSKKALKFLRNAQSGKHNSQ